MLSIFLHNYGFLKVGMLIFGCKWQAFEDLQPTLKNGLMLPYAGKDPDNWDNEIN